MTTQVIVVSDDAPSAKLLEAMKDYNVVILGGGLSCMNMVDMVADIEMRFVTPVVHYPEYGHYRKNFRTGKVDRY